MNTSKSDIKKTKKVGVTKLKEAKEAKEATQLTQKAADKQPVGKLGKGEKVTTKKSRDIKSVRSGNYPDITPKVKQYNKVLLESLKDSTSFNNMRNHLVIC